MNWAQESAQELIENNKDKIELLINSNKENNKHLNTKQKINSNLT